MTTLPAPDRLLADAAWLRSLARKLVGDDSAADLQQDVQLAALARPSIRVDRSWLAAVARNLAVSLRRRRGAEQRRLLQVNPREPAPSPVELAAEAELQRRAVELVLALPQVYRDTILLRFMRGLSVAATAVSMGVPEETVRTRQKRALAMLRAQLAPARGDGRGAAVLLGSLATWGIAMKVKHVVVAAAILLVTLLISVPYWRSGTGDAPTTPSPRFQPSPVAVTTDTDANPARTDLRAEPGRIEVPVPEVVAPATEASLTVRLYWKGENSPAVGMAVMCRRWNEPGEFLVTDAVGEATVTDLEPGDYLISTHDWHSEQVTLTAGESVRVEHALERGRTATGVVLGADGSPVIGATILISAGGTEPQWLFPAGHSDAQGRFTCAGLRTYGLVGATHAQHGTSEFLLLRNEMGVAKAEDIVLRLPGTSVSVRGRIVDQAGRPVAGAWVQLGGYSGRMRPDDDDHLWQPAPATLRTTDADGHFTASGLSPGDCPLLVYRQGFAPHREVVKLHAAMLELAVILHPGGVLTGTVRDADGIAVVGAQVDQARYDFPARVSQKTGSDGSFRFEDLPRGELTVDVKTTGFPSQQRSFTFVGTELQTWEVVLQPGDAIRGRLVDQRGRPLVDWWVQTRGANRRAKTDDDGRFVIAEPTDSTLVVRDQPGFVAERTRFQGVHPAPHEQSFVVPADSAPSAYLRGACRAPDGSPLPGVELGLKQDRWPVLVENSHTAADGSFAIGPLPPGRYRLLPHHAQFAFPSLDVELRPDDRHELGDLTAVRPARLVVRLLGDETACAGATVTLVAGVERVRSSSAKGRERTFVRVLPRRYRIIVLPSGGEAQDAGEIDLQPGADAARDVIVR